MLRSEASVQRLLADGTIKRPRDHQQNRTIAAFLPLGDACGAQQWPLYTAGRQLSLQCTTSRTEDQELRGLKSKLRRTIRLSSWGA